jgi:hypothetical protein
MESSETVNPTPPRRPLLKTLSALSVLGALLALQACSNNDDVITTAAQDTACAQVTDSGSVDVGSGLPGDPAAPEPASGFRSKKLVSAKTYMVVTANPYASKAGCEVLKKGGSAVDAAVAVQAVLGLVEPQSSGLGGGAFMLHYDAKTKKVQSYDGREMAPAAATEDYLRTISAANTAPPPADPGRNRTRVQRRIHAAEAERPLGRHPRRGAHARTRAQGLRQPGLERSVRLRRAARDRRLSDQRPHGRRDRGVAHPAVHRP